MRVTGNDILAYGQIDMFYHDLKVQIIRPPDQKPRKLLTGFMNFVANTFLIKNKNETRTGKVFFIRDRERSTLNYLIKMLLSGVSSSVGVKSNRKVMKQYKRQLRENKLPPF
jgi:hypothetical protein